MKKMNRQMKNSPDDILGQKELSVGDKDYAGNTVLVNDIEEGLIISEIVKGSFRGQIMLIDDPSRVFVGQTQYQNNTGMRILDMMEVYGAVARNKRKRIQRSCRKRKRRNNCRPIMFGRKLLGKLSVRLQQYCSDNRR